MKKRRVDAKSSSHQFLLMVLLSILKPLMLVLLQNLKLKIRVPQLMYTLHEQNLHHQLNCLHHQLNLPLLHLLYLILIYLLLQSHLRTDHHLFCRLQRVSHHQFFGTKSKCRDVGYECRDCVPGVSYKSADGRDEWTPVIRRKRRSVMKNLESESSESDSEVDVSCSRKVEYEKRDGIPGLSTVVDQLNGLQFKQEDMKNQLLPGLDRKLSTLSL